LKNIFCYSIILFLKEIELVYLYYTFFCK